MEKMKKMKKKNEKVKNKKNGKISATQDELPVLHVKNAIFKIFVFQFKKSSQKRKQKRKAKNCTKPTPLQMFLNPNLQPLNVEMWCAKIDPFPNVIYIHL